MANKDFKVKNGLDISTPLPVSMGGTGQTSTSNTLNSLLPSQPGNQNKVLQTDGSNTSWVTLPNGYTRGSTASRPASPTAGDLYFNTDYNYFESYTANGWFPIAAAPLAPTGVTATNQGTGRAYNNGQMSVAFTPNTGGGAPTSFTVTSSPGSYTNTGSSSPIVITGLQSSTQYTYTVTATSPYGTSSASSASTGVTATTVPQAPTIGTATDTGNGGEVSLTFTAGATGGSTITNYKWSTDNSTYNIFSPAQNTSPLIISGLTDLTPYTIYLKAVNANGDSYASSASNSVTTTSSAFESLASTTLASNQATITFNNIPQGYSHLRLHIQSATSDGNTRAMQMYFNNDQSVSYTSHAYYQYNGTVSASNSISSQACTFFAGNSGMQGLGFTSNYWGAMVLDIYDYTNTSKNKTVTALGGHTGDGTYGVFGYGGSSYSKTDAITRIDLICTYSTPFRAGSTFSLYGVK